MRTLTVPTALAYDPNGNLLDDGEFLYTWDAFNRLVEVRLKADSSVIVGQYFYDAMHRRVKRLANLDGNTSLETQGTYVYDGFNCIYEIPNPKSTIPPTAYVWGNDINGGLQSAGGVGGLVAVIQNGSVHYPLFDARGNVTAYTGYSGAIAATFDYLPFGALASATGNANAFSDRFSTKPFDPETGLVYYNFRYYSPELGRWMSRDPIWEAGGEGLYCFVKNNNVNAYDYLGLYIGYDDNGNILIPGFPDSNRPPDSLDDDSISGPNDPPPYVQEILDPIFNSSKWRRNVGEIFEASDRLTLEKVRAIYQKCICRSDNYSWQTWQLLEFSNIIHKSSYQSKTDLDEIIPLVFLSNSIRFIGEDFGAVDIITKPFTVVKGLSKTSYTEQEYPSVGGNSRGMNIKCQKGNVGRTRWFNKIIGKEKKTVVHPPITTMRGPVQAR